MIETVSIPNATSRRSRRIVRRILIADLVLAVVAVVCFGSWRTSTGPAEGTSLNGVTTRAPTTRSTLRVATLNMHGATGTDGVQDIDRTASCLHDYDLVGLMEVRGGGMGGRPDQAHLLGEKLGMNWLFVPSEHRWWHETFGNGLLCTLPVAHWQRFPLSGTSAAARRNLLIVKLVHAGRTYNVIVTHLDRREHAAELRSALELFLSLDPPAILLGDLNTKDNDPQIVDLLSRPGVIDVHSRPELKRPADHVEWIFVRGLRCTNSGFEDKGISDHPVFWAELE